MAKIYEYKFVNAKGDFSVETITSSKIKAAYDYCLKDSLLAMSLSDKDLKKAVSLIYSATDLKSGTKKVTSDKLRAALVDAIRNIPSYLKTHTDSITSSKNP